MLIVLCSGKGSPGVTSAAVALTAAWPRRATLVEADESGSSLAIRARTEDGKALRETPTVATVAAAARTEDVDTHLVLHHAQSLNDELAVVPGLANHEAGSGVVALWEGLANALAASETDVIVDAGRVHTGSLTMPLVLAADVVVVVARADVESLIHLRARVRHITSSLSRGRRRPAPIVPLVVSSPRFAQRDVEDVQQVLRADGLAVADGLYLTWDSKALEQLLEQGVSPRSKNLARTSLVRSAQQAADRLLALRTSAEETAS